MSADILHFGANERRATMLGKLGGKQVLQQAVNIFYDRQMADERLSIFFANTDLSILKWHNMNLMSIAFTRVPPDFDVARLILSRHTTLFDKGLCEDHFDVVMEHFQKTLEDMDVDSELIQEAVQVILPVRSFFAQGARQARQRRNDEIKRYHSRVAVIMGVVLFGAYYLSRKGKR